MPSPPMDLRLTETVISHLGSWGEVVTSYIPHMAQDDDRYLKLMGMWTGLTIQQRSALLPEDFLALAGIPPMEFMPELARTVFEVSKSQAAIVTAAGLPAVLTAGVKAASTMGGVKDREMIYKAAGVLPTPKGQEIHFHAGGREDSGKALPGEDQGLFLRPLESDVIEVSKAFREERRLIGGGDSAEVSVEEE